MKIREFLSKRKWFIPLVIGMLLPFLVLPFLRKKEESGSLAERLARKHGVSVPEYQEAARLATKAEVGPALTDAEWQKVLAIYKGGKLRPDAVIAMMFSGKTKHRGEVLSLMRPKLGSSVPQDQRDALLVLRYFKEPDWQAECQKRVNSSDSETRYIANRLLANDPARKKKQ